jgi:hypothetical protein
MAEPTTNLRVRISADLADIKQGLGLLRGELAKVKAQGATALPNTEGFTRGLVNARTALRGLLAGVTIGAVFRGIIENTREAEDAIGQLRAGLQSTKGVAGVTAEEIAGLAASLQKVTTFGDDTIIRMAAVLATFTKIRGAVFKDAIPAILDLSTRLKVDLNAAAIQVGKALNDPIKGITALGRAGVQFSKDQKEQIKGFVESGQIVKAQKIILGELTTQMGGSASAAANTFGGAIDQAKNALGDLLEGDSSSGGLLTAKEAVQDFTATVQDASTKQAFAALLEGFAVAVTKLVAALKLVMPVVTAVLQNLDVLVVYLGARLATGAIVAAITGFLQLRAAIAHGTEAPLAERTALALLGGPAGIAIAALAAGIYYLATRTDEATKAAKAHKAVMDELHGVAQQNREDAIQLAIRRREEALASLEAAKANLKLAQSQAAIAKHQREQLPLGGESGGAAIALSNVELGGERAAARVKQLQQQVDEITQLRLDLGKEGVAARIAEMDAAAAGAGGGADPLKGIADKSKLAIDAIKRELDTLDQQYSRSLISIAEYYRRKQELQRADIDAQLVQARAEAATATTNEAQAAALAKIVTLQRDRLEIGPKAAQAQKDAEEALQKEIGAVYIRLLEADGKTAQARSAQLEEEFKDLIVRLQREGDAAGVALVRKLINVEAADAQLQQFEAKMQQVMGRLQGREGTVSAQTSAGLMGPAEGEKQLADARAKSLEQLQALRSEAQSYLGTLSPDSPEAARTLDFLDSLDTSIAQVAASQHTLAQQASQVGIDSLTNFFTDLATGAKSFKQAFKDLVVNFISGMAQIAARALATYLVLQLLDSIYPGLGKATAATMGAGVHHTGGIAGQAPSTRRGLSPLLFGAAPRYHGGGIAGLAPDEVPAVLRKGEEVLTEDNPRHRNNAGQRSKVTTPVVVIGDRAVADAMAGLAGQDIVMTHVMNNLGQLRGALAS